MLIVELTDKTRRGKPLPEWLGDLSDLDCRRPYYTTRDLLQHLGITRDLWHHVAKSLIRPAHMELLDGQYVAAYRSLDLKELGLAYRAGRRYRSHKLAT